MRGVGDALFAFWQPDSGRGRNDYGRRGDKSGGGSDESAHRARGLTGEWLRGVEQSLRHRRQQSGGCGRWGNWACVGSNDGTRGACGYAGGVLRDVGESCTQTTREPEESREGGGNLSGGGGDGGALEECGHAGGWMHGSVESRCFRQTTKVHQEGGRHRCIRGSCGCHRVNCWMPEAWAEASGQAREGFTRQLSTSALDKRGSGGRALLAAP
mmetsp:Transcript_48457/g.78088  ORF Transcript_48457/g.78088 Transcript_48457/m.78088 type:complete len:213 (+) Transcript_48457:161-799(+)